MRYLTILAFALALAAWSGPAAAQTPKGDTPESELPPDLKTRGELMIESAPDWFRPILTDTVENYSDEEVVRIIERGIKEGVAFARCMKAHYIALGEYGEAAYRDIPALLDGYRLDECLFLPTLLAVLYRDGRGVAKDPKRARHHFRKHYIHYGSNPELADDFAKLNFGPDTDVDIAKDLAEAGAWFERLKNQTPKEQVITLAKRYLAGDGVPKDADIGYRLLWSVGLDKHTAESAYLLGIGFRDRAFSYSEQLAGDWGFLMYIAAKKGHAQARKEMGLRMLKGATLENSRFFFAYAYFLGAKQAGATDVDDYLEHLKKRLADPNLDKSAQEWIDEGRLPPAS